MSGRTRRAAMWTAAHGLALPLAPVRVLPCGRMRTRWAHGISFEAASVPRDRAKIKTSVAFSALAQADVARLTPPNALPITRLDPRIRPDARFGGVSRAAKGADCKSAGLAFVGSSPTSPTSQVLSHQRPVIRKSRRLMADG